MSSFTEKYSFEDISIVYSGSSTCHSFVKEFASLLRTRIRSEIISWTTKSYKITLTANGTKIHKIDTNNWEHPIHSENPIEKTTYLEMKIICLGSNVEISSIGKI